MISEYREQVNGYLDQHRAAVKVAKIERAALEQAKTDAAAAVEALDVAQRIAQQIQQQAHDKIAGVVTRCLKAVFDDTHEFSLTFERKRGKTEARLTFLEGGHPIDPRTASSGGVVDIAAFALRLICLVISRPRRRLTVILDEPFRAVHGTEYRERTRQLIETLAVEMGIQIIMSTGIKELMTGTIINMDNTNG